MQYMTDSFVVDFEFQVDGENPPSFRQLEAVFERLDQAALLAIMALEPAIAGAENADLEERVQQARSFLEQYEGAPRVIELSSGSISVKAFIKGAKQTAAVLAAAGAVFAAGDVVVQQVDHLVQDTVGLVTTVEQVGHLDPRAPEVTAVLDGQGADPAIRLASVQVQPGPDAA